MTQTRTGSDLQIGSVAGVPVKVSGTWFIVAALITVGFAPFVDDRLPGLGAWRFAVTFAFAVLLYGSVLLHEISHALVARRLGLPVKGITVHFIGGFTEIEREAETPARETAVSAAGPIVSLLTGLLAWLVAQPVNQDVAEFLLLELAFANVAVGVFNLLPALPLDGGHLLRSGVWQVTGDRERGTVVAAWAGRILAGLVVLMPWVIAGGNPSLLGIIWGFLLGFFIWSGSTQALNSAQVRRRLPRLDAERLARSALPVPGELPLAEAIRRAQEAGARALVVVDSAGRPLAVVSEASVVATPEERRPWVSTASVARSLEAGMMLASTLSGEALLQVLQQTPASEYLVIRPDGSPAGVLALTDVQAALAA